jgi:hypothetical protein
MPAKEAMIELPSEVAALLSDPRVTVRRAGLLTPMASVSSTGCSGRSAASITML